MNDVYVRKRDTSLERWSKDKLIASITKAGLEENKATILSSEIEEWCSKNVQEGIINSESIKDKVIEKLTEIDPVASEAYRIYKKH